MGNIMLLYGRHLLVILFNNKSCEVEISKTHFTEKEIKAHRSKITCPRYLSTEGSGMEKLLGGEGDA